jgi:hypothetical protein
MSDGVGPPHLQRRVISEVSVSIVSMGIDSQTHFSVSNPLKSLIGVLFRSWFTEQDHNDLGLAIDYYKPFSMSIFAT